jgi:hypothetical protein
MFIGNSQKLETKIQEQAREIRSLGGDLEDAHATIADLQRKIQNLEAKKQNAELHTSLVHELTGGCMRDLGLLQKIWRGTCKRLRMSTYATSKTMRTAVFVPKIWEQ